MSLKVFFGSGTLVCQSLSGAHPFYKTSLQTFCTHLKKGTVQSTQSRSLIRVEADELTYPLHVVLRYNIEKDVTDGTLDVRDIPKRWNDDMKSLLDVDVPSDTLWCLQDAHWSGLSF